jgi:hypothetical protein
VVGLELQGLEIDLGVLPDLVVHEALEHQGKEAFQRAAPGGGGALMGGAFEQQIGHGGP